MKSTFVHLILSNEYLDENDSSNYAITITKTRIYKLLTIPLVSFEDDDNRAGDIVEQYMYIYKH